MQARDPASSCSWSTLASSAIRRHARGTLTGVTSAVGVATAVGLGAGAAAGACRPCMKKPTPSPPMSIPTTRATSGHSHGRRRSGSAESATGSSRFERASKRARIALTLLRAPTGR